MRISKRSMIQGVCYINTYGRLRNTKEAILCCWITGEYCTLNFLKSKNIFKEKNLKCLVRSLKPRKSLECSMCLKRCILIASVFYKCQLTQFGWLVLKLSPSTLCTIVINSI